MENSFYDLADVLVCDPVAANRAATRSALYALGCRRIEIVTDLGDFREGLALRHPDLALCEASVGDAELCRIVQEVRQDSASYNPFIAIIITAWTMSPDLLSQIANAGADDLLLRPFSTVALGQRIEAIVYRRKSYIVSSNYIGPERRKTARPDSNAVTIDPANSIRIKADARANSRDIPAFLDAELSLARARLNSHKLRCDSVQLLALAKALHLEVAGSQREIETQKRFVATHDLIERRCRDIDDQDMETFSMNLRADLARLLANADRQLAGQSLIEQAERLVRHFEGIEIKADV